MWAPDWLVQRSTCQTHRQNQGHENLQGKTIQTRILFFFLLFPFFHHVSNFWSSGPNSFSLHSVNRTRRPTGRAALTWRLCRGSTASLSQIQRCWRNGSAFRRRPRIETIARLAKWVTHQANQKALKCHCWNDFISLCCVDILIWLFIKIYIFVGSDVYFSCVRATGPGAVFLPRSEPWQLLLHASWCLYLQHSHRVHQGRRPTFPWTLDRTFQRVVLVST